MGSIRGHEPHPDNRPPSYACRHCWHGVNVHNNRQGCIHCKCAATQGEAMPRTDAELDKVVIGPYNFKYAWQNPSAPDLPLKAKDAPDPVNHPQHYGGDTTYEVIKVIHAWDLGFDLGNAVKYIARAGKKHPEKAIEDLEKALFYIQHQIDDMKKKDAEGPF